MAPGVYHRPAPYQFSRMGRRLVRSGSGVGHRPRNAIGREILVAGLANETFIAQATSGFGPIAPVWSPTHWRMPSAKPGCQRPHPRAGAYLCQSRSSDDLLDFGITEHHNAVDNVVALINLALLTGHVGRYGSGLNPLRVRITSREAATWRRSRTAFQRGGRWAARQVRGALGQADPAEAWLASQRHVRGHGTRRTDGTVRHRRKPGAVGGGCQAGLHCWVT